jgi:uncharacterized coiled-coil protein SlyX
MAKKKAGQGPVDLVARVKELEARVDAQSRVLLELGQSLLSLQRGIRAGGRALEQKIDDVRTDRQRSSPAAKK